MERIWEDLHMALREALGREASPTAAIIDSQSLKAAEEGGAASRGLEIVKRTDDIKGFVVLLRRWVVERTFSWLGRNRHQAKDYENLADTLAAFVTLAAIQFTIRRLARIGF